MNVSMSPSISLNVFLSLCLSFSFVSFIYAFIEIGWMGIVYNIVTTDSIKTNQHFNGMILIITMMMTKERGKIHCWLPNIHGAYRKIENSFSRRHDIYISLSDWIFPLQNEWKHDFCSYLKTKKKCLL